MDYADLFSGGVADPVATTDYTSMMSQTPDFVAAAQRPVANPQELERRMTGWAKIAHRLESDPHLLNSIAMAGAAMMQPGPGNIGRGVMAGMSAYTAGTQRDLENRIALAREKRATEGHQVTMDEAPVRRKALEAQARGAAAAAATTEARLPAVEAESKIRVATADDAVKQSRLATRAAELALERGEGEEAVARLERDIRAIEAFAKKDTADERVRIEAQKARDSLELLKAQTKTAKAGAAQAEMTQEIFARMPAAEQERLVKAKFSGHSPETGFVQQERIHRALYKGLPDDDSHKRGLTEDQYVARQLTAGKAQDATKSLSDYVKAVDTAGLTPDPEIIQLYTDAIRMSAGARAGKGTKDDKAQLKKITSRVEYDRLKKGDRYLDPQGVERIKQ